MKPANTNREPVSRHDQLMMVILGIVVLFLILWLSVAHESERKAEEAQCAQIVNTDFKSWECHREGFTTKTDSDIFKKRISEFLEKHNER